MTRIAGQRRMPWGELETEENRGKISIMKTLISMRKNEAACKSLYFHFPEEYAADRLIEYIKLDDAGNQLEVLLNCSEKTVDIKDGGEVLFARQFENGQLGVMWNIDTEKGKIRWSI